ncbi:chalcone isomerase family protein [Undibacterium sp. TJN25]|uniref:chalcone isomerase family protein n=1 Tax=Undibacterium sp. TJN25 TaxID=3413056 RepID=UPI003BF2309C
MTLAFCRLARMALVCLCMLAANAWGKETAPEPSEVPAPVQAEFSHAHLAGAGSFRWFGLKIYDAALWVTDAGYRDDAPGKNKFALELQYARALVGTKIAKASYEEITRLKLGSEETRQKWLTQMNRLFPDVREGDRITGIYLPAQGARFYLNGNALGEIADAEFAHAFFAIWLDKNTTAPALRSKLLSQAAPAPSMTSPASSTAATADPNPVRTP